MAKKRSADSMDMTTPFWLVDQFGVGTGAPYDVSHDDDLPDPG
jgi:hypothetical protein